MGANVGAIARTVTVSTITQLELLALSTSDNNRSIQFGKGLRGSVRAGVDGAIAVHVSFRYRFQGKTRETRLGTWKSLGGKSIGRSLKSLFDEADRIRGEVLKGFDPVAQAELQRNQARVNAINERLQIEADAEVRRLKIEADRESAVLHQQRRLQELSVLQARMTVKQVFEQWHRLELIKRADRGAEVERSFKRDVFPLIGDMAVADVHKAHAQQIVDAIMTRATEKNRMVRSAKKTLSDLRQMFGFALDRDYLDTDPTARIKKAKIGTDSERDRVLSEPELVSLFQMLPQARMADTSRLALLIQLASITRIGEVLSARWEHIDFERRQWTLPETKNGKSHKIFLSDFALQKLGELHTITGSTPWLFPASRSLTDHVCEKTVTKQVNDRQRPDLEPMSGRTKNTQALVLSGGKWTPHDLRRTGATMMAELGALPDVIEKCLNHAEEKKIKRIYQRAQYEGPMRNAWRLLGERLSLLEAQSFGAANNVVNLRTA